MALMAATDGRTRGTPGRQASDTRRAEKGSARLARLEAAWHASRLDELPEYVRCEMLASATERTLQRGEMVRWDRPILLLMASGQACIYLSSTERLAAIRYLEPGEMTGILLAFMPNLRPSRLPLVIRAATTCTVVELSPQKLGTLAQDNGDVAWRVGRFLAEDVVEGHTHLANEIFLTVRQLLAQTLLLLAVKEGGRPVVRATQQDLADAIGSVRAVVGRALIELRDQGLVSRDGRVLTLTDIDGLGRIADAR